jgi:hypothetical protein
MGVKDQFALSLNLFASTAAGVKPAPSPNYSDDQQPSKWARQVPGNGSAGRRHLFAAMDRRWVHIVYLLVDVFLISLSSLLAFCIRFVPFPFWRALHVRRLGLGAGFPLKPYVGFLMLYMVLILLLCQSQDLYKTRRGRSVPQESWAVVRAVILATLVLAAFLFCSNLKIVSREVVGISAVLNAALL